MVDIQAVLHQQLVEQTQELVARGGPDAVTGAGRAQLHWEPSGCGWYDPPAAGETLWPLAAVLAALSSSSLHLLQEDWNEALGHQGALPVYLHETAEGHYTAMVAESLVLAHLVYLSPLCTAEMLAENDR
jgi:hypothetical protein